MGADYLNPSMTNTAVLLDVNHARGSFVWQPRRARLARHTRQTATGPSILRGRRLIKGTVAFSEG